MALPPVAKTQLRWFHGYVRWYLRRNFHRLYLLRLGSIDQLAGIPLLICLNHPSWWDPLLALHLSQRLFRDRQQYAPIAAGGLAKYRFFERLGFFGIEPATRAGALRFLTIGQTVLSRPDGALWVTPQGDFSDVRRPVALAGGVGHLVARLNRFAVLPVALEYAFWDERYPEAFAALGHPVIAQSGEEHDAATWTELFTAALQSTQDKLSQLVIAREESSFEPLLAGNAGVGGVYDLWRWSRARLTGKRWQAEHGSR